MASFAKSVGRPASPTPGSWSKDTTGIKPGESRALFLFLEKHGLDFYTDSFLCNGFTMANFELVTSGDLGKMRITNHNQQKQILYAVDQWKQEKEEIERQKQAAPSAVTETSAGGDRSATAVHRRHSPSRAPLGPSASLSADQFAKMLADGTIGDHYANRNFTEFTATMHTANECSREATLFLQHHTVAKAWPRGHSVLARTLNLSNAAPPSTDPLYSIIIDGDTSVVPPQHKHEHGYSAKFCPVCVDHVSESLNGAWQFNTKERVMVGDGAFEEVFIWKPFHQQESLKIEYGYKRQNPSVKIRGKKVEFGSMTWGKDKKIRRIDAEAIPFPSLKKRDIVRIPERSLQPQIDIAHQLQSLAFSMCEAEEKKHRFKLEQDQDRALVEVLAKIHAMMLDYFDRQRVELERRETEARARLEGPEYEAAVDALFEVEEQSVRDVALAEVRKEAEDVASKQCALLENMETIARNDVERQEAAIRENLNRLIRLMNQSIRDIIAAKSQKSMMQRAKEMSGLASLRCPVCRKLDCAFFKHPWKPAWRQRGGPLESRVEPDKPETLSTLVGRAGEKEYTEFLTDQRAAREEKFFKSRFINDVTAGGEGSPQKITMQSPGRALPSPIPDLKDVSFTPGVRLRPLTPDGLQAEVEAANFSHNLLPPRPASAAGVRASMDNTTRGFSDDKPIWKPGGALQRDAYGALRFGPTASEEAAINAHARSLSPNRASSITATSRSRPVDGRPEPLPATLTGASPAPVATALAHAFINRSGFGSGGAVPSAASIETVANLPVTTANGRTSPSIAPSSTPAMLASAFVLRNRKGNDALPSTTPTAAASATAADPMRKDGGTAPAATAPTVVESMLAQNFMRRGRALVATEKPAAPPGGIERAAVPAAATGGEGVPPRQSSRLLAEGFVNKNRHAAAAAAAVATAVAEEEGVGIAAGPRIQPQLLAKAFVARNQLPRRTTNALAEDAAKSGENTDGVEEELPAATTQLEGPSSGSRRKAAGSGRAVVASERLYNAALAQQARREDATAAALSRADARAAGHSRPGSALGKRPPSVGPTAGRSRESPSASAPPLSAPAPATAEILSGGGTVAPAGAIVRDHKLSLIVLSTSGVLLPPDCVAPSVTVTRGVVAASPASDAAAVVQGPWGPSFTAKHTTAGASGGVGDEAAMRHHLAKKTVFLAPWSTPVNPSVDGLRLQCWGLRLPSDDPSEDLIGPATGGRGGTSAVAVAAAEAGINSTEGNPPLPQPHQLKPPCPPGAETASVLDKARSILLAVADVSLQGFGLTPGGESRTVEVPLVLTEKAGVTDGAAAAPMPVLQLRVSLK